MIITHKDRLCGERTPRFYRVAYHDVAHLVDVCYPLGIHWLVRAVRRAWEWTIWYSPSRLEAYGYTCIAQDRAARDEDARQRRAQNLAQFEKDLAAITEHNTQL